MRTFLSDFVALSALLFTSSLTAGDEATRPLADTVRGPVRVFILAGQSNMEGKALASTLEPLLRDEETRERFRHLKSGGEWTARNDVWVTYLDRRGRGGTPLPVHGPLSIGFGGYRVVRDKDGKRRSAPTIGPELGIGHVLGDHFAEPVLLIKIAWGGRAVKHSFRPPSAPPTDDEVRARLAQVRRKDPDRTFADLKKSYGSDYRKMLSETRRVLDEIATYVPMHDADAGYEISGLIWFQGWNDGVGKGNPDYVEQLACFVRDIRKDLDRPELPFVIGELGVDGPGATGWIRTFRDQQAAVAALPEWKGTVRLAKTAPYWDTGPSWMAGKWDEFREAARANEAKPADDPSRVDPRQFFRKNWLEKYAKGLAYTSDRRYHYNGSGRSYYEMGQSMARTMLEILNSKN